MNSSNVEKYIEQAERKKEYNRKYYQNRIKPSREQEKLELEELKKQCHMYKTLLDQQGHEKIIKELQAENAYLQQTVQSLRVQIYSLMIDKKDEFLSKVEYTYNK